jgi:UPF0755 protein
VRTDLKLPATRVVSAFIAVVVLTFALHLVRIPTSAAADFTCGSHPTKTANVEIKAGESGSSIASSLFNVGIVKSSDAYFRVAVGDSRSQRVAPGNHNIDVGICAKEALTQLLDSSRITGLINIQEGAWISELVPQFVAAGISQQELLQSINSVSKPAGFSTLEGLLFPAQYSFEKGTSAKVALQAMISRADNEMHRAGFYESKKEFSPQQLLIIASLVQAEGNTQDFAKISRVIRNRLIKGMPLQFDSTVHYIKKSRGSVFLSTASTLINSPYNTYKRYGLPPGPINNPGANAMSAAANPAPGDWLFFITVAPFDTRYTNSLDQFNTWKVEYEKNLKDGKFRSTK